MYSSMAYYVAKKLGLRPTDILDGWTASELIVAYGVYANEETNRNYNDWKQLDTKQRAKIPKPDEYAVYFEHLEV